MFGCHKDLWNDFQKNDGFRDTNWLNITYPFARISQLKWQFQFHDSRNTLGMESRLNPPILARNGGCQTSSKCSCNLVSFNLQLLLCDWLNMVGLSVSTSDAATSLWPYNSWYLFAAYYILPDIWVSVQSPTWHWCKWTAWHFFFIVNSHQQFLYKVKLTYLMLQLTQWYCYVLCCQQLLFQQQLTKYKSCDSTNKKWKLRIC